MSDVVQSTRSRPTSATGPELSRDEMHQVRWLLGGVLTLLGVVTVAYMELQAWWLMAAVIGTCLATTVNPTLPARLPRVLPVLAFPVIAAFFALDLWANSELLPAMVRLDLLLLLYRSLVYRQRRDDLQVIVLGLFLVVVAGVLTVSVLFALQLVMYAACALVFLLVLTLLEAGGPDAVPPPGAGAPAWARQVSWPRLLRRVAEVLDWRIVLLAGGLFIGLIGASALLFLAIPRFQLDNGLFLDRFIAKKARSGFSDTIRFGDVTEIQQDTSIALHVDVADPAQIPASPYWRMLVLDDYRDGTFRLSPALRHRLFELQARTGSTVYGARLPVPSRDVWTLYLEPGVSRFLPMLGPFRVLRFADAQSYQQAPDAGLIALTKDPVTMTAYRVTEFGLGVPSRDSPGGFYRERPLSADVAEAAADRRELHALVTEAAGEGPWRADEFAARTSAWLRQHHTYSLSPRIPDGPGDPLIRWIASDSPGHCELFAGAFVLLARAAGFPARVVTGFHGGSWNAFAARSFTVRNSDAHAWAELYDPQSGAWVRADPLDVGAAASSRSGTDGAALHTDRSLAARFDSLRIFWYRRVVSFDQAAQVHTLKVVKELAQSTVERLRFRLGALLRRAAAWWRHPWEARRLVALALAVAGAAGLTWLWRQARRVWRRRGSSRGREDPVRREAARWLTKLAGGATADATAAVMADLQRLRYARRETWPDPEAVFRTARRTWRDRRRGLSGAAP